MLPLHVDCCSVLSEFLTKVDTQCDKLAAVIGGTMLTTLATIDVRPMTFITLSINLCVQHDMCGFICDIWYFFMLWSSLSFMLPLAGPLGRSHNCWAAATPSMHQQSQQHCCVCWLCRQTSTRICWQSLILAVAALILIITTVSLLPLILDLAVMKHDIVMRLNC